MVGYDFGNISRGFWVVSGAWVGFIPFQGWYIMKVNPKCDDSQCFETYITIWRWDKMVDYDFENFSQGFWVVSGARVGYIPFSGWYIMKANPKCFFKAYITIWHWDKMVTYDFESISRGFWWLLGARVGYMPFSGSVCYESQPKMSLLLDVLSSLQ